jgi:hypothetical protein
MTTPRVAKLNENFALVFTTGFDFNDLVDRVRVPAVESTCYWLFRTAVVPRCSLEKSTF